MFTIMGIIKVGTKKRKIYVGESPEMSEATKLAIDFLEERVRLGLGAEIQVLDAELAVLAHYAVEESKPTILTELEMGLVKKGMRIG
jgi:hypothetical protein